MIYFLAVVTLLIFYHFFRLLGRGQFAWDNEGGKQQNFEFVDLADDSDQKIIQGQWATLKKIHNSLTSQAVMKDLVDVFEKIHAAFAQGVPSDIKNLVSKKIFEQFQKEIKQRKGYILHMYFLQPPQCFIKQIVVDEDKNCTIDTEFQSEQLVYIEDKQGKIVDNPHKISETVKNYWIFKKNLTNISSPWMLVEMV